MDRVYWVEMGVRHMFKDSAFGGVAGLGTIALASVAALGLAYAAPGGLAASPIDADPTGAVERAPAIWHIADDITGASCEARPGPRLSGGAHTLTLDETCAGVFEALETAVLWQEELDGSVALSDPRGRSIVTFAPADGPAMEAVEPSHAMLSLSRG